MNPEIRKEARIARKAAHAAGRLLKGFNKPPSREDQRADAILTNRIRLINIATSIVLGRNSDNIETPPKSEIARAYYDIRRRKLEQQALEYVYSGRIQKLLDRIS